MLKELMKHLQRPDVYSKSTRALWNDEHISKGMLEAHLNPSFEAASRKHDFIDKSVEWIAELAPPSTSRNLLDLGCGPGLYAERLDRKGYTVTGIDFSSRSIHYAKEQASCNNQDIQYIYKNYLEIDYKNAFDLVLLIYCDFAVLSDQEREVLLKKVFYALKPGGKFIFDVFTVKEFENKTENNTWFVSEEGGFWSPGNHMCVASHFIYPDDVRLDQYVIIENEDEISVVRNWSKGYTKETIVSEVKKAGFQKVDIYSDVTGKRYDADSKTICIVVEK